MSKRKKKPLRSNKKQGRGPRRASQVRNMETLTKMEADMTDVQNLWSDNDSDPVSDFKAAAKRISESNFRPAPEDPVLLQMHERLRRTTTQLDRSAYGLPRTSVGVSEAQHDVAQHSDVGTKPIIVIDSEGMSHAFRERLAASIAKHYPSRHQ